MREAMHQERLKQRIAHRWVYWQPWAIRHIRILHPTMELPPYMKILKFNHNERCMLCLRNGIPWTTIVKHKLDNPLLETPEFQFNLNAAVERRRYLSGRKPGVTRTKEQIYRRNNVTGNV